MPTAAIPPNLQQQAALQLVEARYLSGANPLQEGQTTRISITYRVRNPLSVPLNYTGTAVIDFGDSVGAVSATATAGTTSVTPGRVTWDGFVLAPGETATITVVADVTPSAASVGGPVLVVAGTLTTARTAAGGVVNVRGGSVDSTAVQGLLNGGIVIARAPAMPAVAPPAAAVAAPLAAGGTTGATAAAGAGTGGPGPAAPAASQAGARPGAAPPVGALARTGTGLAADHDPSAAAAAAAMLGLIGLAVAGALTRRHRPS